MKFSINTPESELTEGYFTLILKHIVLFIIFWLGSWFLLLFRSNSSKNQDSDLNDLIFNNPKYISILIAVSIVFYFVYKVVKKFKLGLITSFEFHESFVNLEILNTINGSSKSKDIYFDDLKTIIKNKENFLYGKQRVLEIYENNKLITKLNIELTAWCRHTEIDIIIENLMKWQTTF